MSTNDNDLLHRLFRSGNQSKESKSLNPEEYARNHARTIDATGRLLERIGLLQRDKASLFGWKSTPHLKKRVAKTKLRRPRPIQGSPRPLIDDAFLELLGDTVNVHDGPGEVTYRRCAFKVLEALHLIREDVLGNYVVDEALAQSVTNGKYWDETNMGELADFYQI